MVDEPYVNHIPTMTGGIGRANLTAFYRDHFIFSNPDDTELQLISRTVGIDRVIDEFLFKFTHDRVVDWLYVFLNQSPMLFGADLTFR
jgi:carboxymethylenebutenolidase